MAGFNLEHVRDIFVRARDLPEFERGGFLDQACGADAVLRTELENLLAADLNASSTPLRPEPAPGAGMPSIAGYEVQKKLGEGGMGTVWRAVQLAANRVVALKLMSAKVIGAEQLRRRFEREVELSARLEHPGIARLYDSGVQGGICYYAMELVEGVHLDRYVADAKLDQRQVLKLMAGVCRAVEHAHQKGVIHRDLKPSNILVSSDGQTHVVDFGLARTFQEGDQGLNLSMEGNVAGTPAYMSPEQAAGRLGALDTRTDVYSLGVILYRLLTGRSPHDLSGSHFTVVKRIVEEEVRPPRLACKKMDRDLESLLLKALARDPADRYPGAGALAQDLENYLDGEPLTAQPATTTYFLRKRIKKYRWQVGIAAGVAALLAAVAVLAYMRVAVERTHALAAAKEEQEASRALQAQQTELVAAKDQAQAAAEEARQAQRTAELRLADALVLQGDAQGLADRWGEAKAAYWEAYGKFENLHVSPSRAEQGLGIAYAAAPPALLTFTGHMGDVYSVAFSPDGRTALSGSLDHTLKLWDLATGTVIRTLTGHNGRVRSVAFSPDGRTALSASKDKTLKLWDLATGREIRTLTGHTGEVNSVAFSPDGRTALSASRDKTLKLWDLATGTEIRTFTGHTGEVYSVAFSPDGRTALSGSSDQTLKLWDLATGKEVRTLYGPSTDRGVTSVAFSPDGRTALSGSGEMTLTLWDLSTGKVIRIITGHAGDVTGIAFSPDGRTALSSAQDQTLKLWDLDTGKEVRTLTGHNGAVWGVAFSPDGRTALSGGNDHTLKLWDLAAGRDVRTLTGHHDPVRSVAFSPDGRTALSGGYDKTLKLWDLATATEIRTFTGHAGEVYSVAFSPDGRTALSGSMDKTLKLWDLATGREVRTLTGHQAPVRNVAFSPDGRAALSASKDRTLKLWDLATGKEVRTLTGHTDYVYGVAFSPDGRTALSASADTTLKLWDLSTGKEVRTFRGHNRAVDSVAFAPDGRTALSGSFKLRLWDIATGKEIRALAGHAEWVTSIAFTSDARTALSGSVDKTLKLWDLATGKEVRTLTGHTGYVTSVAFRPDGRAALSGSYDKTLKLWDFSRAPAYLDFDAKVPRAQVALRKNRDAPAALAILGNWYAFRGVNAWAVDDLEKARAGGAAIDPLTLARCYWELGNDPPGKGRPPRALCLGAAAREFTNALAAAKTEADRAYLKLCAGAVRRAATQPATAPTGGNVVAPAMP